MRVELIFIRTNKRLVYNDGKPIGDLTHTDGKWCGHVYGKAISADTIREAKKRITLRVERKQET